ncbi:hypothetical protein BX616_003213 [Lobosporangium transversale]|uniref:Uncharacterized protein n=1 Tax=Lobosporangium transversale TaxID=64571 RepID=A0A1Y2GZR7_9FUNG|nr:hypothetical protein BCR41DRAFT_418803 [Lobosporangium transversale]KAF9916640.1 hypothetical protein BX616_003213 [Lobosporangium transversale]ORZ27797.1 hypothetical protein BCR41DRAFT_418803 [Lobosporangium transversale]|eukprot:XP_021885500.1 hypothetical protein BCR41DRAFT_418803 [Lobosporangium transversale]
MAFSPSSTSYPYLSDPLSSFLSALQPGFPEPSSSHSSSSAIPIHLDGSGPQASKEVACNTQPDILSEKLTRKSVHLSKESQELLDPLSSIKDDNTSVIINENIRASEFSNLLGDNSCAVLSYTTSQQSAFLTSLGPLLWEADRLERLLGLNDQDIAVTGSPSAHQQQQQKQSLPQQPLQREQQNLNSIIPPFSIWKAESKKLSIKEEFVHPGFYFLSNNDQAEGQSSKPLACSPTFLKMPRKRSLREDGASSSSVYSPEGLGMSSRHDLSKPATVLTTAGISTPLQPWPPKTLSMPTAFSHTMNPSTSSHLVTSLVQQQQQQGVYSDISSTHPYMVAFSSPLRTSLHSDSRNHSHSHSHSHSQNQKYLSPSMQNGESVDYQQSPTITATANMIAAQEYPPSSAPQSQPQSRKRRTSKLKAESCSRSMSTYNQMLYKYSSHFPLSGIPPPLQQQHQSTHDFLYQQCSHPYLIQSHPQQQQRSYSFSPGSTPEPTKASNSQRVAPQCRRNPGEVPASTLPPDLHEVLLSLAQNASNNCGTGSHPATTRSNAETSRTIAKRQSEPAISYSHICPHSNDCSHLQNLSHSHTRSLVAAASPLPTPPAIPSLAGNRNDITSAVFKTQDKAISSSDVALKAKTGTEVAASEPGVGASINTTVVGQSKSIPLDNTLNDNNGNNDKQDLHVAATFVQSLSTVTTLDPTASKLIDQLLLQDYLRTAAPAIVASTATDLARCSSHHAKPRLPSPSPSLSPVHLHPTLKPSISSSTISPSTSLLC